MNLKHSLFITISTFLMESKWSLVSSYFWSSLSLPKKKSYSLPTEMYVLGNIPIITVHTLTNNFKVNWNFSMTNSILFSSYFFVPVKKAKEGLSEYYYLKTDFPTTFSYKVRRSL